ncbi:AsmA family protein [Pseudochrobactrum sp. sp1633]|uniref:AsmA family protein n=1 Tax=Pseudochrobactrum sp. sp1633 TaxID=3036706 RepID=UPI0025A56957|nr:AsmA family protein [Pseudochrobactrum sp. sp1633]MDM8345431.1 AsmA family protein [Pseudochrobactrum sp. sp1633]HWD13058.1 AsmA family protein [Pseudochrobactrum sp.]
MGRLFVAIGGVLVLVLTLALVVPPFVDWTGYRNSFEQEASRILGRPVHVNGTAKARLLPFPSVTFSDVTVEGKNGRSALTMDEFSMDAELMPFLRGQILIFDMRMEKPHLFAGLDAQGQLDWDLPEKSDFAGSKVRLEKLTLRNGQITLRDEMRGREQQFAQINATLSAGSLAGPWRVNGHMQADGEPFGVEISTAEKKRDTPLRLRVRLLPDDLALSIETDGDVTVQDGKPFYKGQFSFLTLSDEERKKADAKKPAVTLDKLRLTGKFAAQSSGFDIEEFRMEQGEADAPYVINGKAQLDLAENPHFMISADGQQVYLDGMKPDISMQDNKPADELPVLSFREKIAFLQTLLERIPVPDIPGNIDLRLPAIVASGTTIRSIIIRAEPNDGAWNISQLQADLPGRTQIEAKGKLLLGSDFGFQGSFLLASRQPAGFASWLSGDAGMPVLGQVPAAGFSGKINLSNDLQRVDDLEIVLGDTVLQGSFERSGGVKSAASSALNIEGKALDAGTMQLLSSIFLREGDLSALAGENLTVNLKAGPVKFSGLEADQLDTAFRLSGGKLDFDRLLISGLEGATISATGALRPFDHSVNATLDATVLADDLEPLLHRLNTVFPREPLISALSVRAGAYPELFAGTKLDLLINAENLFANGETVAKPDEANDKQAEAGTDKTRGNRVKNGNAAKQADKSDIAELSFSLNGQTGAMILSVAGSSKGTLSGSEPMQLSLTANAKAASGEAALVLLGLPVVPLGLMGEAEVNLQAQGAPVAGMKTSLEISGDDGRARLDGVITLTGEELAASGKAVLKSDDLEPFLATTGYALPFGRGFGSGLLVNIASDFQFGKNIVRLPNLQGKLDDETVSARLDGSLSDQSVAQLRGEIKLERFDLSALFAAMAGLSQPDITIADGTGWSETAFGNKTNLPLGLDVKVSAAQAVMTDAVSISDFSARLIKADQQLQISEIGGNWASGKLSGKLELNNANGSLLTSGDLRLSGGDMAVIYQPEGYTPPVTGESDIKLGFTGSGKSMADLVHSLAGEGAVSIDKAGIAGLNVPAMAEILRRSDALSDSAVAQVEPKQAETERSKLSKTLTENGYMSAAQMQTTLSLAGGIIRAPSVKLQNDKAILQADLQLDLNRFAFGGTGALEMVLPQNERNDVAPQVQFTVSGSWQQPQLRFDYQPMVQFLTQRGLLREQQRVEAAQALIIEKQRLKREADYYTARAETRKRQRIEAEEALRKRAEEAAGAANSLPQELQQRHENPAPDFKPSLDEFLQTLPETQLQ